MLEVHGDLKETADTSIPTPSLSSWPVKQPNQGEAREGGGSRLPGEEKLLCGQKPMQSHRRPWLLAGVEGCILQQRTCRVGDQGTFQDAKAAAAYF